MNTTGITSMPDGLVRSALPRGNVPRWLKGITMISVARTPTDHLRQAIENDGRPLRRIAAEAMVPTSVISRFMNRERGLTTGSFDLVAGAVGLELRPRRRPR
jgi:hypothetical protein